jgi:hypothetical protein
MLRWVTQRRAQCWACLFIFCLYKKRIDLNSSDADAPRSLTQHIAADKFDLCASKARSRMLRGR